MNIKPFNFTLPPLPQIVIPTGFMVEVENRFKAIFFEGGFLVWYGYAGAGKTTCAEWLTARINESFDAENPLCFKALHYETGKSTGQSAGKRTLRTLFKEVTGYAFDSGTYRESDVKEVAEEVLYTIMRKKLGVICIDEAGLLNLDAISAFALLLDIAKKHKHNLTIILIGMDDLPLKMDKHTRPQLYRRVHDWCNFKDYSLEDTFNLLSGLHPYFKGIDRTNSDQWNQVRIVHELTEGLPGLIVQFLAKFNSTYKKVPDLIDSTLLRSIHLNSFYEYKEIMATATGKPLDKKNSKNGEIIKKSKKKSKKNN